MLKKNNWLHQSPSSNDEIPLIKFTNPQSDSVLIVWDCLPSQFWVKQNNNAYIIFIDGKKPIFFPNILRIQFSKKVTMQLLVLIQQNNY